MSNKNKEGAPLPLEERGCTDIICCIVFVGCNILMIICYAMGVSNSDIPSMLAVWDSSA